jgi:hypothetical protein
MAKPKQFPIEDIVFFECGQCGSYHWRNLPGHIDCRADEHRFTVDDLDGHYGAAKWEELSLEDQERALEDGEIR